MNGSRLIKILVYVLAVAFALFSLFPLFWMLSTSLKPDSQIYASPPRLIPRAATLEHYAQVLGDKRMIRYFINSTIIATSSTILGLIVGICAGYGFSKFTFIGKGSLLMSVLLSRMIPRIVLVIPLYILFTQLHLTNTYGGLILVYLLISLPLSTWLMKAYFDNIPKELQDAALVDGCNQLTALIKIILPVVLPAVFAVGMYIFMVTWSEFLLALILTLGVKTRPLTVGLMFYKEEYGVEWGALTAASILMSVPVIVVFLLFHRYLVEGLTRGAVKG